MNLSAARACEGFFGLYHWSDVILQRTVALRTAWPLLLVRRPWVVIHNDWIDRDSGFRTWLKQLVSYCISAKNVAISQAVADRLPDPSHGDTECVSKRSF